MVHEGNPLHPSHAGHRRRCRSGLNLVHTLGRSAQREGLSLLLVHEQILLKISTLHAGLHVFSLSLQLTCSGDMWGIGGNDSRMVSCRYVSILSEPNFAYNVT